MKIPATSDPYDILLHHNFWGTREILNACRKLTTEQFTRSIPVGPAEKGGLHANLTHIISVIGRWSDRIAGRTPRVPLGPAFPGYAGPIDDRLRTPDELDRILEVNHNDLAALSPSIRADPGRIVKLDLGGTPYAHTASALYLHALTHGHYHRAQCVNVLKQLGVPGVSDKLPDIAVTAWQNMTDMREQP
ncbi:MAG: DinB family protein [Phycisphaerales bacterium]